MTRGLLFDYADFCFLVGSFKDPIQYKTNPTTHPFYSNDATNLFQSGYLIPCSTK
jgi:hypothetical protein